MEEPKNRQATPKRRLSFPTQDFVGMSCPNCGTRKIHTSRSEVQSEAIRERTHVCRLCPAKWKSIETIPITDREDLNSPEA